jgi:putative membrane protein
MYGSDHGSWMHGSGMFGGGLSMILMWLIPIAVVVALVVFLTKPSGSGSAEKTALDILKERYARGEIGKDEFNQKKRDIGS